jgi:hypothetical protein
MQTSFNNIRTVAVAVSGKVRYQLYCLFVLAIAHSATHRMMVCPCPNCQTMNGMDRFYCSECINEQVHAHHVHTNQLIHVHAALMAQVNHILTLPAYNQRANIKIYDNLINTLNRALARQAAQYSQEVDALKIIDKYVNKWREISDQSASQYIENLPTWKHQLQEMHILNALVQEKRDMLKKKQAQRLDQLLKWFRVYTSSERSRSIMGIELPDDFLTISLRSDENLQLVSSALGFICQLVIKISDLLSIPLTMNIHYQGSYSFIENTATGSNYELHISSEDQLSVEKLKSNVRLLDEVIFSLCRSAGVSESKLRPYQMLYNIMSLHESLQHSFVADDVKEDIRGIPPNSGYFKDDDDDDFGDELEPDDFEVIDKPMPPPPTASDAEMSLFMKAHGYR